MNTFMRTMNQANNFAYTENGALTHKTTGSKVLDLFALGGAYRNRSDEDVILLFKNSFEEDPLLAMKCLFYLRDVRGGQGERRFFKVCLKWLAKEHPETVRKNIVNIAQYGRYDDLYCLVDTPLEKEMFSYIKNEINIGLDIINAIK